MNRIRDVWRPAKWACHLLLIAMGCSVVWFASADDKGPIIPKGKGEQCVAETDFMRRDHMRLLVHQRDDTVIRGLREEPFSLAECVDCHVQNADDGKPLRVDAEGQFCQSCHAYAAVKIDCFGCHAAVPDQAAAQQPESLAELTRLAFYRHTQAETQATMQTTMQTNASNE